MSNNSTVTTGPKNQTKSKGKFYIWKSMSFNINRDEYFITLYL